VVATPLPVIPPTAKVSGPSEGFAGEPITFNASESTAGSSPIASYSWNFGDGTSAGPFPKADTTTIYNNPGAYEVTVLVTDKMGQSSSANMQVTISARITTPVEWTLSTLANKPHLPGTVITLQFQQGTLSGFAGCNSYNGSYTATPAATDTYTVTISGITNTQMACPTEVMNQEQLYLTTLPTVTTATIQGDTLTLKSPQGDLIYIAPPTVTPH
jgi:heat shock protein HslJ